MSVNDSFENFLKYQQQNPNQVLDIYTKKACKIYLDK